MRRAATTLAAALAAVCLAAPAQKPKKHPIDVAYEACIGNDYSTARQCACAGEAYENWDKELNRVYKELARRLTDKEREALKASQTKWIEHRDLEFRVLDAVHAHLSGSMYIPVHAYARTEIVKARTLVLTGYLNLLKEEE